MAAKGTVLIDSARCKGCSLCVEFCPQGVLHIDSSSLNAKGYRPAILADPDGACTGCAVCALVCPDTTIAVYRELLKPPKSR